MTRLVPSVLLGLAALVLTGCAAAPVAPSAAPDASTCEVEVVVNFGPLDEPALQACGPSGVAADILAVAGVTTEGTVDYGDQVVCRVNGQPSADEEVTLDGVEPFVETCQTLNDVAYWALWVKAAPDAEWEYAQEGAATLELAAGQSVGLVYTPITDTITPTD